MKLDQLSPNLLLVLIHAKARGRERRDAIRGTWVSPYRHLPPGLAPIQYRFVVGGQGLTQEVSEELVKEAQEEKDLLVLEHSEDSLQGLTSRTLNMLTYAVENFEFSYVLKCDDDTFVDIMRIASELQMRESRDRLYWGYMLGHTKPMLYGPYRNSNWTYCSHYFPYACGGGYVLSHDIAELVVRNRAHLAQHVAEDASLGLWLAPFNIERRHDARFDTESFRRGCKKQFLVSHKVSTWEMPLLYRSLEKEGTYCSFQTEWVSHRYGYVYNWNVSPSSCCSRLISIP